MSSLGMKSRKRRKGGKVKAHGCQSEVQSESRQESESLIENEPNAGVSAKHLIDIISP